MARPFNFWSASIALTLWGVCKVASTAAMQKHMVMITKISQDALQRISNTAFQHMHKLDLTFHKKGSKSSIFAVNKALRSIEGGLRFSLGFFAGMFVETSFLAAAIWRCCGKLYLFNCLLTIAFYCKYTRDVSNSRIDIVRKKKDIEK